MYKWSVADTELKRFLLLQTGGDASFMACHQSPVDTTERSSVSVVATQQNKFFFDIIGKLPWQMCTQRDSVIKDTPAFLCFKMTQPQINRLYNVSACARPLVFLVRKALGVWGAPPLSWPSWLGCFYTELCVTAPTTCLTYKPAHTPKHALTGRISATAGCG